MTSTRGCLLFRTKNPIYYILLPDCSAFNLCHMIYFLFHSHFSIKRIAYKEISFRWSRSCFFAGLFSYICPIGCTNFETSHIEKFRFPPSADRWNIIIIRNMISRPESVESHQGIVLFLYPILFQELVSFDFVH